MEDSKKKTIMIVVIVACLVAAGVITFATRSGGGGTVTRSSAVQVLIRCNNPECKHEWQMDGSKYTDYVNTHAGPTPMIPAAIVCPKCGKESGYRVLER